MQNKQKVIAVSGGLGSGKDTVAQFIIENSPVPFKQTAFAKSLKKIVATITHVPYETTLSQDGKNVYIEEFGMTIGEMLQTIGTDVMRSWNDEVWIKSVLLETKAEPETNWIITDCRFPNEADFLKKNGAHIIRVERPDNPIAKNSKRDLNHPSETSLNDYKGFNEIIINDGTLDDLKQKVIAALNNILEEKKASV